MQQLHHAIRRFIYNMGVLIVSVAITLAVYKFIMSADDYVSPCEYISLLLIFSCLGKIVEAMLFCITGFILRRLQRCITAPELDLPVQISNQTAILTLTYNEDPAFILERVQYLQQSLQKNPELAQYFDLYILSDSNRPEIIEEENRVFRYLDGISYRRRPRNIGMKVGNVLNFCEKYGNNYEYFIVLDSDSLMNADTIFAMASLIESDPTIGIVQPSIHNINSQTIFARSHAFVGWLVNPIFITGMNFWNCGKGFFYGHNAIIRLQAYYAYCKIPDITQFKPLNGQVLSHDFVDSALLARAGYKVLNLNVQEGSYEELPPTLIDYAKRDMRWCKGNMQHIILSVTLPRMSLHNRLQLLTSCLAYFCSALWFTLIVVCVIDLTFSTVPVYVVMVYYLRPIFVMVAMLLSPHFLGYWDTILSGRLKEDFGGFFVLTRNLYLAISLHSIKSPILMIYHVQMIVLILFGRKEVTWGTQNRKSHVIPWGEAFRTHAPHTLFGLCLAGFVAYRRAWSLFAIALGPLLSAPIAVFTSYRLPEGTTLWRTPGDLPIAREPEEELPEELPSEGDESAPPASLELTITVFT